MSRKETQRYIDVLVYMSKLARRLGQYDKAAELFNKAKRICANFEVTL